MDTTTRAGRWWGVVAVVLGTAIVNHVFFTGLFCSDDGRYLVGIQNLVEGIPLQVDDLAQRRLFFLLPGAFGYFFTHSIDAAIWCYAPFFTATVGCVAFLARRMGGTIAAVAAAFVVGLSPLMLGGLGSLVPDAMCAAFFAAALCTASLWVEELHAPHASLLPERWALATGVLGGLAVITKESGAILMLLPLGALGLPWLRSGLRMRAITHGLVGLIGLVATLAFEGALFRVFAGTWHSSLVSAANPHDMKGFMAWQGSTVPERFAFLADTLDRPSFYAMLGSVLAGLVLIIKERGPARLRLLLLWAVLVFSGLFFTVGTTKLKEWVPPVIQARYYIPLLIPAAVLLGVACSAVIARIRQPRWQLVALAVVLLGFSALAWRRAYPRRGSSYAATMKESLRFALEVAAAKYPQLPLVDTPSGWTTDFHTCRRLVLQPDSRARPKINPAERQYPATFTARPPFVLLGTGDFFGANSDDPFLIDFERLRQRHGWNVELIGVYSAPTLSRWGDWLLTRETAVSRIDQKAREKLNHDEILNANRLYLVSEPPFPPDLSR